MNRLTQKFIKRELIRYASWFFIFSVLTLLSHISSGQSQQNDSSDNFALLKEIMIKGNSIFVKTDRSVPYNVFKIGSPPRLVLELTNTENDWKKKEVTLKNNALFTRVRSAQFQNEPIKITRVVMDLKTSVEYEATSEDNVIVLTAKKIGETSQENLIGNEDLPSTKESALTKTAPDSKIDSMAAAPTPLEIAQSNPESSPALVQAIPQSESPNQETKSEQSVIPETESAPPPTQVAKKTGPRISEAIDTADPSTLFGRQSVTLDFYDIEVRDLFKILSEKSGVNVVFGEGVSGKITLQLREVPFKDAVDTVLSLKGLKLLVMGRNIVQVMTPTELDKYKTSAITVTKVFPINYAKATDVNAQLITILTTLGGKGKTLVDDRTNSIIVTDTPEGIEMTNRLIADLDKPTPQVMIEAKIVQVQLGKSISLGIQWGIAYTDQSGNQMVTIGATKGGGSTNTPGSGGKNISGDIGLQTRSPLNPSGGAELEQRGAGFDPGQGMGIAFGFVKDVTRLNAALTALQQKNKSKLLSNPKIATLNNQGATIKSEVIEPYITTETSLSAAASVSSQKVGFSRSGINLTVTPTINADGRITMKITPDITASAPTSVGIPKTTSNQAQTTVIVKDGETFVIGGLISEIETDEQAYIPLLGRIPILGHLFKKTARAKARAELLVFVTPKIIPY